MEISKLRTVFEKFLIDNKIPFERRFGIKDDIIDYKIILDGKVSLVEVKSDRANIFTTIGKLLNAKRTCSDIFLFAPQRFMIKMKGINSEIGILERIGLFELEEGNIKITKRPEGEYYFKNDIRKIKKPKQKYIKINEFDFDILTSFENQPFLISDISKKINSSLASAQQRVGRLKRAGLIEEIGGGNPKAFKVIRKSRPNEKIEIKTAD